MINGEHGRWVPEGKVEAGVIAIALVAGASLAYGMYDEAGLIMPAVTLAYGLLHGVGVRITSTIERIGGWTANLLFVVTVAAMYSESGDAMVTAVAFPVVGWMIMQRGWHPYDGPIWWLLRGVVFRAGPLLVTAGLLVTSTAAYGAPDLVVLVAAAELGTALFLGRLFDACQVRARVQAES